MTTILIEAPESGRVYPYGSIVIVSQLPDPQGGNPKNRRCIVLTPDAEMPGPNGTIDVVAIAGYESGPLLPEYVILPYQWPSHPHPVTGLIKRSVAVCSWRDEVEVSRVVEFKGKKIPNKEMAKITRVILSLGS